ncbi:MAG: immune inhibitor A [Phaeodactylibacter sp.]|nr:immune inhibitor A [Phaeodactylibacter sp.]
MNNRLLFLLSALFFTLSLHAQERYMRAAIHLDGKPVAALAAAGIDVTHGEWQEGRIFTSDFSESEAGRLRAAGFAVDVLIEDVQAYYVQRNQQVELRNPEDSCDYAGARRYPYATPEHFVLGSMGGFYTYQEMLDQLDAMAAEYPDLISARQPVGDFVTQDGHPIYWMRLSDHPNVDEDEPGVFYNALHHAREPNGLSQLIFFMWYMLENYDTDPEIRALVDRTELYFIPCINPDGYIYNEQIAPEGGGMWRKNRRPLENNTFGVDLNRNYGYEWGLTSGGSNATWAGTYFGPEAFSEPETQAVKAFCEAHEFRVALNYHTYGNLLVYPWNYSGQPCPDDDSFSTIASLMNEQNNFLAGTTTQTVGYYVSGGADDWMYGDTLAKPSIISFTPEVGVGGGGGGFWPPVTHIENNCKGTMLMNLTAARAVLNYADLKYPNTRYTAQLDNSLDYTLRRYGLAGGDFQLSLTPLTPNVSVSNGLASYSLAMGEVAAGSFDIQLLADMQEGEEALLLLELDGGNWSRRDTVRRIYFTGALSFYDPANSFGNWETLSGNWGLSDREYFSPPTSFTDSPDGEYLPLSANFLTLDTPLAMPDSGQARLVFKALWDIAPTTDYAQLRLSVNNGPFFPVCGRYTERYYLNADEWEPAYMGQQRPWVEEDICLTQYAGPGDSLLVEFVMVSGGGESDGFYFDDLMLVVDGEDGPVTATPLSENRLVAISLYPNPALDRVVVGLKAARGFAAGACLQAYNSLGQLVASRPLTAGRQEQQLELDTHGWQPGLYYVRVAGNGATGPAQRVVVGL